MPISSPFTMTECHGFFVKPATSIQRQYEALRAYFVEKLASAQVARRFGYTPAAFRMLCYEFRRGRLRDFFAVRRPGPREQPKKSKVRDEVVALRKRNSPSTTSVGRSKNKERLWAPLRCARSSSSKIG